MDLFTFLTEPITYRPAEATSELPLGNASNDAMDLFIDENSCNDDSLANNNSSKRDCDTDYDLVNNPYLAQALDVIIFNIVIQDSENHPVVTRPFKPTMAHQVFGQEELISGYRNLHIYFTVLPNSFNVKIDITYDDVHNNPLRGEIADDIDEKLSEWFPHRVSSQEFGNLNAKENYELMFGTNLVSFAYSDEEGNSRLYVNVCDCEDADFIAFHRRFQALIVFYIDAASIIDFNDKNWNYFYVYKEIHFGKKVGYIPIGFCTVYNFTMSSRARIAQLFILPNFQLKGIGTRLLGSVYKHLNSRDNIQYITVESPCEEFTIMRDKLDLRLIIKDPVFEGSKILDGFSQVMESTAKTICKLCAAQVKHLYFIMRCFYAKSDPIKYDVFIKYLKREIHLNYKRKLNRINSNVHDVERIIRIKRIVKENYLVNRKIERDVKNFLKAINPQLKYIDKLLKS